MEIDLMSMDVMQVVCTVDWSTVIQNLNGIGTVVALLLTWRTLRIMVKQRRDSFRPKLMLTSTRYGDFISNKESLLHSRIVEDESNPDNEASFEVLNVGNGIARNVVIVIAWDVEKAMQIILSIKGGDQFKFSEIEKKNGILKSFHVSTTFDGSFSYVPINHTRELGTMLTLDHKTYSFVFPYEYTTLLKCWTFLWQDTAYPHAPDLPNLFFTINYQDIEGNDLVSKYEVAMSSLLRHRLTFSFLDRS